MGSHARDRMTVVVSAALLVVCGGTWWDATHEMTLASGPVPILLAVVLAAVLGSTARALPCVLVVAAAALLCTGANQQADPGAYSFTNDLAFFLAVLGGPALAGHSWGERSRAITELGRLSRLRAAQRDRAVRTARLEQQGALAERVHRRLGRTMGEVVATAAQAARVDEVGARAALAVIELLARDALDDMRSEVAVLRDGDVPDTVPDLETVPDPETVPDGARPRLRRLDLLAGACALPVVVEGAVVSVGPLQALAAAVLGVLLGVPLASRRRHPLAAAGAFAAIATSLSASGVPFSSMVTPVLPLILVAYGVGCYSRGRVQAAAGLALVVASVVSVAWLGAVMPLADGVAPTSLVLVLSFSAGLLARAQSRRRDQMQLLADRIGRDRPQAVRLATARQRAEIARDLHDSVAASMTVVCLHAAAAQLNPRGGAAVHEALATIAGTAAEGLTEVRSALYREGRVDTDEGLSVERVVATARDAGMRVVVTTLDVSEADPTMAALAARIIREGLVNAARHAPGTSVEVRVHVGSGRLVAEVVDAGSAKFGEPPVHRPAEGTGTGHGLTALATRVADVGGVLDWRPGEPAGWTLRARLPLHPVVRS